MTVDTAAVRRRMGAIAIFRRATDDHATITRGASVVTEIVRETVPALCDALDEERERVRVYLKVIENVVEDLDSGASYQAVRDMLVRFLKDANP